MLALKTYLRSIFIDPLKSIDKFLITVVTINFFFGLIMVMTASPAIAAKLKLDSFYFIKKHILYLSIGWICIYIIALLPGPVVKRLSILGFFLSVITLVFVIFSGYEVKGERRWLNLGFFSLQPAEFAKTFFVIFTAWIISIRYKHFDFPVFTISSIACIVPIILLLLQPDFGMAVMFAIIFI